MISTYSKFYYGIEITENNARIDFDEGGGEITAILDVGTYTPEEIADQVALHLNGAGTFTYTCTFNRTTKKLTITSSSSVDLLMDTGTNSLISAFETLGYDTTSDETGTSFVADNTCCTEYAPQFLLQSYTPVEQMIEQLHSTVNETITGKQELITYGDMRMMRCNITFITDISQPSGGPIINNASGVSQALDFLHWCSKKNKIEFMPDKDTPGTFINLVFDSSAIAKDGTKFRLKELYDRGLNGYFETELMTFREVD